MSPAISGTSRATCSAIGRASVLIRMISASTSGGCPTIASSRPVLLISWASSSNAVATCCASSGEKTSLDSARFVKLKASVASMTAPATARPNDRPNDPPAEFTPAASLMRSSSIGPSV